MRVLNIGLDNSILNKDSKLAKRAVLYGDLVEKYIVIAPYEEDKILKLSERTIAYGVGAKSKFWGLLKIYKLAKKIIGGENMDVISVQDQYYLGLLGLILARKLKKGLEIQVHGFEKYFGLRKIIAGIILPRSNAVRCVSQRLKRELISKFRVKEERITVVPIYTELRIKNYELRIKKKEDKFIFLTVGRLVPVKNIRIQIEAIAGISRKSKTESRKSELWIIGDGPDKEKLQAKSYKLKANVNFLGWQDDMEKFYSQANVFLLTSNYEGWGLAVIEAASCGLPIIMTDVGCAGELVKDGESGIVIPVGSKEKLKEAMIKIIEDEDLKEKLGNGAREAIKKLPSKEEILSLYKKSWGKAKI